ncbi:MAG: hypothetical protein ACFE9N_04940 [Promethearchaeota archaeon]
MEVKAKFWLFCFLADILIIVGWFVPYFYITVGPITAYYWLWGLVSSMGVTAMLPLVGDVLTMFLVAIIILIIVIINVVICYFIKKKGEKKMLFILKAIIGIIILILAIVPLVLAAPLLPFAGFYLILVGSIILILTGILSFMGR